jgi:hypothetical protein
MLVVLGWRIAIDTFESRSWLHPPGSNLGMNFRLSYFFRSHTKGFAFDARALCFCVPDAEQTEAGDALKRALRAIYFRSLQGDSDHKRESVTLPGFVTLLGLSTLVRVVRLCAVDK